MKKKKKSLSLPKKVGLTAIGLFVCLVVAVEVVQSDWAKEKARALLTDALLESGFQIRIDKMEGNLPQFIKLQGVSIQGKGLDISVRSLETRLSLIRLLKKEVAFTTLNAEGIQWKSIPSKEGPAEETKEGSAVEPKKRKSSESQMNLASGLPKLAFAIYVEHFDLKEVSVPGYGLSEFKGRLRLAKRKSSFTIIGQRAGFPESSAKILAVIKEDGAMQLRAYVKTPTLKVLFPSPWKEKMDADVSAEIVAAGPFASLWKSEPGRTPIRGRISGSVIPREIAMPDPMKGWIQRNWSFNIGFNKQEALSFSKISAKSDLLNIKGKASFDSSFHFSEANLQLVSEQIISTLPIPSSGRFIAQTKIKSEDNSIRTMSAWKIPFLTTDGFKIEDIKGFTAAAWQKGELAGSNQVSGTYLSEKWEGKTDFAWKPKESVFLKNMSIEAEGLSLKGKGNLEIRTDWLLAGNTELDIGNLQSLHIPDSNFYGSLKAKGQWKPIVEPGTSLQGLYLDLSAADFYYGPLYARKASLYSDLIDPFHTLTGNLDLSLEQAQLGHLSFSTVSLETNARGILKESQPFKIFAEGKWKHPLEIRIDGSWNFENRTFTASILNWKGSYFTHPYALALPVKFDWSPEVFRLSGFAFNLADAEISGYLDRQGEKTDAGLKLLRVPIDLLSVNPLDLPIAGSLNLDTQIHEEKGQLRGDLNASIEKMEIVPNPQNQPEKLAASGTVKGHFDHNRLDLKGNLQARGAPLLNLDLSLPIHFSIWPFESKILYFMNAKGQIALNGRIEDFSRFLRSEVPSAGGRLHLRFPFQQYP